MGDNRTKRSAVLLLLCCTGAFLQAVRAQTDTTYAFQDLFEVQWAGSHIVSLDNGDEVQLVLDQSSGAGFQSKSLYTYGYFSVNMKLIAGNSAGTVTAWFLSSAGNAHDEIDFEFLGNTSGQPYIVQTNLFASGVGGREQRFYMWFDPTTDFHSYAVVWNHAQIIYLVDNTPIRVFKNLAGVTYPNSQGQQAFSALFEASSWATRGGQVPIDWSAAPFVATYGSFDIAGCINNGVSTSSCATAYQNNWWEGGAYTSLSAAQISDLQYIRSSYMVYDYCTDVARNPTPPAECAANSS